MRGNKELKKALFEAERAIDKWLEANIDKHDDAHEEEWIAEIAQLHDRINYQIGRLGG